MMKTHNKFLVVFFIVLILDQVTKFVIKLKFPLNSSREVVQGIFSITYVQNTGVSFGLFKGLNTLFIIISIAVLLFFFYLYKKNQKYSIELSLISSGITGNLIDRIFLGSVIDFFNFKIWPVFNIADSVIFIGIVWLIISTTKNNDNLF